MPLPFGPATSQRSPARTVQSRRSRPRVGRWTLHRPPRGAGRWIVGSLGRWVVGSLGRWVGGASDGALEDDAAVGVELEQVREAAGELLAADGGEHHGGGADGDGAVDGVGEDAAAGGVEADVGGVEEQEARGGEERAGEERAARLAVGEGDEVAVEEAAEPHFADDAVAPSREGGDGARRALDPLPRVDVLDGVLREPRAERGRGLLLGGDPAHLDVGVHLGEELRLALERDDGDRALGVAPARAGEAVSDLGLGREERAGEEAGEDGLSAAVRADDAPVLALPPDEPQPGEEPPPAEGEPFGGNLQRGERSGHATFPGGPGRGSGRRARRRGGRARRAWRGPARRRRRR